MSTQYPSEREEVGWMLKDIKEQQSSQPTGEPAPCVWRATSVLANPTYRAECVGGEVSVWLKRSDLSTWSVCPYCKAPMQIGHPLTVGR